MPRVALQGTMVSHIAFFFLTRKENQECIEMIFRGADRMFVQDDLLLDDPAPQSRPHKK
jgi:hypothetical protein